MDEMTEDERQILSAVFFHNKIKLRILLFRRTLFRILHRNCGKNLLDRFVQVVADKTCPMKKSHKKKQDKVIQLLANLSGRRNFYDPQKFSVLHFSAAFGWMNVLRFLLESGADPNAKSVQLETPLHVAALSGHKEAVALLLDSGADISACDYEGCTVLHAAVSGAALEVGGSLEVVKFLVENGADYNDERSSITPIFLACSIGAHHIIAYFMEVLNNYNDIFSYAINLCPSQAIFAKCIYMGACFKHSDYAKVERDVNMNRFILQDAELCTQVILNQFNKRDLPELYKLPMAGNFLPIESLKITSNRLCTDIKDNVIHEIEVNGFCNLIKPKVILLRVMAVKSYIGYYNRRRVIRSALKRPALVDVADQPGSSKKVICLVD